MCNGIVKNEADAERRKREKTYYEKILNLLGGMKLVN